MLENKIELICDYNEIKTVFSYIVNGFNAEKCYCILEDKNSIFFIVAENDAIRSKFTVNLKEVKQFRKMFFLCNPVELLKFLEACTTQDNTIIISITETQIIILHNSTKYNLSFLSEDLPTDKEVLFPQHKIMEEKQLIKSQIELFLIEEILTFSNKILSNSPKGICDVLQLFFNEDVLIVEMTDIKRFFYFKYFVQNQLNLNLKLNFNTVCLLNRIVKILKKSKSLFINFAVFEKFIFFYDTENKFFIQMEQSDYFQIPRFKQIEEKYNFNLHFKVDNINYMTKNIKQIDVVTKNNSILKYFFILLYCPIEKQIVLLGKNNISNISVEMSLENNFSNNFQIGLNSRMVLENMEFFKENILFLFSSETTPVLMKNESDSIKCVFSPFSENKLS